MSSHVWGDNMNAPLIASLMDAGIAAAIVAVFALPALLAIVLSFMNDFIETWGHFKGTSFL
jgi:hypothetical protein